MSRRRLTPGAVVTGLVLLVAAMGLGVHEANRAVVPTVATTLRATVGEELAVGGTVVQVGEARSAPQLRMVDSITEEVEEHATAARWLVVRVSWAGEREPSVVRRYAWRDGDGVEYATSDLYGYRYQQAQPGEWWHEDVVFEVPKGAAAGGTLRLLPEGNDWALPMELGEVAVPDVEAVEEIDVAELAVGRG